MGVHPTCPIKGIIFLPRRPKSWRSCHPGSTSAPDFPRPLIRDNWLYRQCDRGAIQFDQKKQNIRKFMPSRLFIYYNERAMEGTINSDAGAQIRDGVKSIANLGVCPETEWPYDIRKFADKPAAQCYKDATKCEAVG
jgi:C1A family cysteine protease